jgi:carbon storage regulator
MMLVLTRRVGESVLINGDEIKIQILNINGHQTRFGIQASKNISVDREEIHFQKHLNPIRKITDGNHI